MATILPIGEPSAARVAAAAEQRLRQSPYYYLKKLACSFAAGTLTLRGSVPYHQLRQFAEAIVSRVEGVERVENLVQVFNPQAPPIAARGARSAG